MSAVTNAPVVSLALPGDWARAALTTVEQRARLVALLDEGAGALGASEVRRAFAEGLPEGADSLWIRTDGPAGMLLLVWPPITVEPRSTEETRSLVPGGAEAVEVVGEVFPTLRGMVVEDQGVSSATYWVRHPESGRILVVQATAAGDLDALDNVASGAVWTEMPTDGLALG